MPAERDLGAVLADELHALIGELPDGDGGDLAGLLAQGRRNRRLRRAGGLVAAAAATVAAALLVTTLIPGDSSAGGPSGPASTTTTAPAVPKGPAGDPLTLSATFGWLPANFNAQTYQYINNPKYGGPPHEQDYAVPTKQAHGVGRIVQVELMTEKGATASNSGWAVAQHATRVGTANGHPVFSESSTDNNNGMVTTWLDFSSADGQVAQLWAMNTSLPDLLRIAQGVHFDRTAMPFPFAVRLQDAPQARAGARAERVNGRWTVFRLELAVEAPHPYEAEIVAVPANDPAYDWTGRHDTVTHDGVRLMVGLSDHSVPGLSLANLYPETGGQPAGASGTFNDPTGYGDPAAFRKAHVTLLGANPSDWTVRVLGP